MSSLPYVLVYILLSSTTGERVGNPVLVSGPYESGAACVKHQAKLPTQRPDKNGNIKFFECNPTNQYIAPAESST